MIDRCEETVRAFVNISSIGLVCCKPDPRAAGRALHRRRPHPGGDRGQPRRGLRGQDPRERRDRRLLGRGPRARRQARRADGGPAAHGPHRRAAAGPRRGARHPRARRRRHPLLQRQAGRLAAGRAGAVRAGEGGRRARHPDGRRPRRRLLRLRGGAPRDRRRPAALFDLDRPAKKPREHRRAGARHGDHHGEAARRRPGLCRMRRGGRGAPARLLRPGGGRGARDARGLHRLRLRRLRPSRPATAWAIPCGCSGCSSRGAPCSAPRSRTPRGGLPRS